MTVPRPELATGKDLVVRVKRHLAAVVFCGGHCRKYSWLWKTLILLDSVVDSSMGTSQI